MKRVILTVFLFILVAVAAYLCGQLHGRRSATLYMLRQNESVMRQLSRNLDHGDVGTVKVQLRGISTGSLQERARFLEHPLIFNPTRSAHNYNKQMPRLKELRMVLNQLEESDKESSEPPNEPYKE